jgi:hypothetical protein
MLVDSNLNADHCYDSINKVLLIKMNTKQDMHKPNICYRNITDHFRVWYTPVKIYLP